MAKYCKLRHHRSLAQLGVACRTHTHKLILPHDSKQYDCQVTKLQCITGHTGIMWHLSFWSQER